jgi:collagenase-like PrtC family protease
MKLSVACNFDPELPQHLASYPVYEIYGKLTQDYFGGGRPAFYLPEIKKAGLAAYVKQTHKAGIQFNYLINSVCMSNRELTKEGQRELRRMLDWLCEVGVDSVTVASVFLLKVVKRCYPQLRVRLSAHRFTDNARKARFWEDHGADCIVVSEVNIYREFKVLEAIRRAVSCDLQLIVNNACRQDCAIAGPHATALNHASQTDSQGVPLDYCSMVCLDYRLREPVNYLRANWIRPEDLSLYEDLGYENFKIVERNTPTPLLLERVAAYAGRSYHGNLLDLVWNVAYAPEKINNQAKDAYSLRRFLRYFLRPSQVNLLKLMQLVELGKHQGVLFPRRRGRHFIEIDNKALDGFIDRFREQSCLDQVCEECGYCHEWATRVVHIDPEWKSKALGQYDDLFEDMHTGAFWEPVPKTAVTALRRRLGATLSPPA